MAWFDETVVRYLEESGSRWHRRAPDRIDVSLSGGEGRLTLLAVAEPPVLAVVYRDLLWLPEDDQSEHRLALLNRAFVGKFMLWGAEELVLALETPAALLREPADAGHALEAAAQARACVDAVLGDLAEQHALASCAAWSPDALLAAADAVAHSAWQRASEPE